MIEAIVSLSHCLIGVPAEIRILFPPNWGLSHCLIVSPGSRQRSGFCSRPTGDCLIVSLSHRGPGRDPDFVPAQLGDCLIVSLSHRGPGRDPDFFPAQLGIVSLSQLGFLRSIPHRIASRASHRIASHPEHRIQSIASRASHRIASRASHPEYRRRHPLAQRRALAGQPSRARGLRVRAQGVRALGTTGNKTHTGHSQGSLVGIRVLGVRAQGVRALGTTGARVVTPRPGKSSRPGQGGCERLQKKQRPKSPAS